MIYRQGADRKHFAVIGLGRFGMSILQTLATYDVNILACDRNMERLQMASQYATHVVQADAADETALDRIGLNNFDVAVLAMGTDFDASLLATMKAKEEGVPYVVARANDLRQRKIFRSVGADLVVLPEREMGAKIGVKLMRPNVVDVLEEAAHHTITEMRPTEAWVGKTVRASDIRRKEGMTLLAVIRHKSTIIPVPPELVLEAEDILIALSQQGESDR